MNQYSVVVTTINQPTNDIKEVVKLAEATGNNVVVIGDKKTPADWSCSDAVFVSYEEQLELYPNLGKLIPANHYSRKNLGYLISYKDKGNWIYETDDDNRPTEFGIPKQPTSAVAGTGWVNLMPEFSSNPDIIWPRGFPLEKIQQSSSVSYFSSDVDTPVIMGLVDQDPDVDAIYRMTRKLPYYFDRSGISVSLIEGSWFPWNSQNTWWRKDCLALMYLPVSVTPRVTDILRSYVATGILHRFAQGVGITSPNAVQVRNQHNLLKDFIDEVPLYTGAQRMMECIVDAVRYSDDYPSAIRDVYVELAANKFVFNQELECLDAWLVEVKKLQSSEAFEVI